MIAFVGGPANGRQQQDRREVVLEVEGCKYIQIEHRRDKCQPAEFFYMACGMTVVDALKQLRQK